MAKERGSVPVGPAEGGVAKIVDVVVAPGALASASFSDLQAVDLVVGEEYLRRERQTRTRFANFRASIDHGLSPRVEGRSTQQDLPAPVARLLTAAPHPPTPEQEVKIVYDFGSFELQWDNTVPDRFLSAAEDTFKIRLEPFHYSGSTGEELIEASHMNLNFGHTPSVVRMTNRRGRRVDPSAPGDKFIEQVMDEPRFAKLELINELIDFADTLR